MATSYNVRRGDGFRSRRFTYIPPDPLNGEPTFSLLRESETSFSQKEPLRLLEQKQSQKQLF